MVTSKTTKELPMTVPEVLKGAFHSVKISGDFGSAVKWKTPSSVRQLENSREKWKF